MPPFWMWSLDEELEYHFEKVKARREAGATGSALEDDDDVAGLTLRNEYARGRGGRNR